MALKRAQDRLIAEDYLKSTLSSFGSPIAEMQGFEERGLFDPFRYDFRRGTCAVFDSEASAGTEGTFEVTIDKYSLASRQFIMDSRDRRSYLFIDSSGVTLGFSDKEATWSTWAQLDGTETTLRFVRTGSDIQLYYYNAEDVLVPHSDGAFEFSQDEFKIDAIGAYNSGTWKDDRESLTGHIFELFLGELHWVMGTAEEYHEKRNYFSQDAAPLINDLKIIQGFDPNDWVDLGGGSTIRHSLGKTYDWTVNYAQTGYVSIPYMKLGPGDRCTFKMMFRGIGELQNYQKVMDGSLPGTTRCQIQIQRPNQWDLSIIGYAELWVDGVRVSSGDPVPLNKELDVEVKYTGPASLQTFGSRFNGADGWFNGNIWNINIFAAAGNRTYSSVISRVQEPTTAILEETAGDRAELVTNGTFDGGSTVGWEISYSSTLVASNGVATFEANTTFHSVRTEVPVVAGETYSFEFNNLGGTLAQPKLSIAIPGAGDIISPTNYEPNSKVSVQFTVPSGVASVWVYPVRDSEEVGTVLFEAVSVTLVTDGTLTKFGEDSKWSRLDPDQLLEPEFIMNDDSSTRFPYFWAEFTSAENSNFANFGGIVSTTHRFTSLADLGESNGAIKFSWDRHWDDPNLPVGSWQGMYIDTITGPTAADITTRLHYDGGVKEYVTANYNGSDFTEIVFVYNPATGEMTCLFNGTVIPELSGVDFRYTGAELNDASLQSTCGTESAVGIEKRLQLLEVVAFANSASVQLTKKDFAENRIYHGIGLQPLTLILPPDGSGVDIGATVYWELEYPSLVTVRRGDSDALVLCNSTGLPQEHSKSNRGVIVCGSVSAASEYDAYFTSSQKASAAIAATSFVTKPR